MDRITGESAPVEALLPFRTSAGEVVCERGVNSTDVGEAALPGGEVAGAGKDMGKETGVGGLSAKGGVGACKRNEGAIGSRDVAT